MLTNFIKIEHDKWYCRTTTIIGKEKYNLLVKVKLNKHNQKVYDSVVEFIKNITIVL